MAKNMIFHFGGQIWADKDLQNIFSEHYDYQWLPVDADVKQYKILDQAGKLNSKYQRSLFFFEEIPHFIVKQPKSLIAFPAYQIFYPQDAKVSEELADLLKIKGAYPVDFQSPSDVAKLTNSYAFEQDAYKENDLQLQPIECDNVTFIRKAELLDIKADFSGNDYGKAKQVVNWRNIEMLDPGRIFKLYPEVKIISGKVDLIFQIFYMHDGKVVRLQEITFEDIKNNKNNLIEDLNQFPVFYNVSMQLRAWGKVHVQIGQMHYRRVLLNNSIMIPGDELITDEEDMNRSILFYFNPGDLKPPLAVYFAGFRTKEGFEGRAMMNAMECPYILVADPRLVGGAYYQGSPAFEKELADRIQEKLDLLGFTNKDLIFSGLSMGTFGSLYYASDLRPRYIIIGKPLASMGDAARYIHVNAPGSNSIHDILYMHMGEATKESAERWNARFWNKFRQGDFSDTNFLIAYMKEDDVDPTAYPRIRETLKEISPNSKILYKGLTGRHNDDSPGIVAWFTKQYYNVLDTEYHRVHDHGLEKMLKAQNKQMMAESEEGDALTEKSEVV